MDPRIDRLRGYFAILVMIGHTGMVLLYSRVPLPDDMGKASLGAILGYFGFLWVVGFIVISGFCIARSTDLSGENFSLGRYSLRRATRLYPMIWTTCLLALGVELLFFGGPYRPAVWEAHFNAQSFLLSLTGLGGLLGQFASTTPAYTITYELLYYAIWGAAWAVFGQRTEMAFVAAAATGLVVYAFGGHRVEFAAMLFGCWLLGAGAWFLRDVIARPLMPVPHLLGWLAVLGAAAGIAVVQGTWLPHPVFGNADLISLGKYLILGCAFAFLLVVYTSKPEDRAVATVDRWLGGISYPLFLAHGPVLIFLGSLLAWCQSPLTYSLALLVLCCINLSVAHLLAKVIEQPVMRWRRSTATRLPPAMAPAE
jgi:peptidoglycan/LPS O-acetylase OafA/YrhL